LSISGVQNVVNCVVKRGGVVVKVWLERQQIGSAKIRQLFCAFFIFFCGWAASNECQDSQSSFSLMARDMGQS
jgi:hypothetical protein